MKLTAMKSFRVHAAAFIATALLITAVSGCKSRTSTPDNVEINEEGERDTVYSPVEANGFEITKFGDESSMLTVKNPWQGADGVESQLLILRGNDTVPDNFDGEVVTGDAKRIVVMSSTNVAMLEELDALDRLAGVSGMQFIYSTEIDRTKVADVGNEADADYEKLLSLSPDLVMVYGIASPSVMESRLASLNIPFVYIGDYLEQSPLGKAEWLVAVGEIVGRRDEAIERFATIRERYNELKESVSPKADKPKVIFNAPYNDAWFMPPADSYMVRFVEDAGGEYVYPENNSGKSVAIGDEKALLLATKSDLWLCPGSYTTIDGLKSGLPVYANVPPVINANVYNNNLRSTKGGGNDFYESGAVHPERVLEDLIEIIDPSGQEYEPYYFYRLK